MASAAPSSSPTFPQALAARLTALRNAWEKAIDAAPVALPDLADTLAAGLTQLQRERRVDQASLLELADQGHQLALRSATPAQALALGQQLRRSVFEVTLWIDSRPAEERASWAALLQPRPVEGEEPAPPPPPPPEVAPGEIDPSVPVPDDSWGPSPDEWPQAQEAPEALLVEPAPPSSEWIEPPKPVRHRVAKRRPFRTRRVSQPGDQPAEPPEGEPAPEALAVAPGPRLDEILADIETEPGLSRLLDGVADGSIAIEGPPVPDPAPTGEAGNPLPGDWSDLRADAGASEAATSVPAVAPAGPIVQPAVEPAVEPAERPVPAWVAEVGQPVPADPAPSPDGPSLRDLLAEHRHFRRRARRLELDAPLVLLRQQVADLLARDQADLVVKGLSERHDPTTPPLLREVAEYLQATRPALAASCLHQADRIEALVLDGEVAAEPSVPAAGRLPAGSGVTPEARAAILRAAQERGGMRTGGIDLERTSEADLASLRREAALLAPPEADRPAQLPPEIIPDDPAMAAAVEAKLADPEVTARLDDLHARYDNDDLETVSHAEVAETLRGAGAEVTEPLPPATTTAGIEDEFLRRPEVSAGLDELHGRLDRGEVKLVDLDSVCARIEQGDAGLVPFPVTPERTSESIPSAVVPPPPVTGPVVWPPEPSLLTLIHRRRRPGRPGRRAPVDPLAPLAQLREQTADHLRRNDLAVVTILTRELPLHQGNQESADLLTEMGDYLAHSNPDLAVDCYIAAWTADPSHGQALSRLANWNERHETPSLDHELLLAVAIQAAAIGHPATAQKARDQLLAAGPTAWPERPAPPPVDDGPIIWEP